MADGREILSSVVASQIDIHRNYGGVVPELASREHLRSIVPVVREALARAGLKLSDIDAHRRHLRAGAGGFVLVGLTYGKVLASALGKPLVGVNHLEGHVRAVFLEGIMRRESRSLPAVCLIVSGGHTVMYEVIAGETGRARFSATLLRYTDESDKRATTRRARLMTKSQSFWLWDIPEAR